MTKDWNTRTKLVHEGSRRSQYGEMAEAIFLTQGFVYPTAEAAEARVSKLEAALSGGVLTKKDSLDLLQKLAASEAREAKLRAALTYIVAHKPTEPPTGPKDSNGYCAWSSYHTARAALQDTAPATGDSHE